MPHSQHDERRHFQRIPLQRPATLSCGGRTCTCQLADVSLKGALLIPGREWHADKGDKVAVDIVLDDLGDATIHMSGEIAHIEGDHVGIQCHQLDLDSATLLRRVVELNLADPDLLQRELHAMIEEA
jgi:hypothetical protein